MKKEEPYIINLVFENFICYIYIYTYTLAHVIVTYVCVAIICVCLFYTKSANLYYLNHHQKKILKNSRMRIIIYHLSEEESNKLPLNITKNTISVLVTIQIMNTNYAQSPEPEPRAQP